MNLELLKTFDTETLARWYNNFNYFTWPEDFIETCPDDFYLLPDYNENYSIKSKYIIINPINKMILEIIGKKEALKYLWLNILDKNIDEFEEWINNNKGDIMKENTLEEILFEKGMIIHFQGMPFQIKNNTVMLGREINFKLAKQLEQERMSDSEMTEDEWKEQKDKNTKMAEMFDKIDKNEIYILKEVLMNGTVTIDSWETLFNMSFEKSVLYLKNKFNTELKKYNVKIIEDTNSIFRYCIENNEFFPVYGFITSNKISIINEGEEHE